MKRPSQRNILCFVLDETLDKGWAWVTLGSCILMNVCGGIQYLAFSVLYHELSDVFDATKFEVGWIESIGTIMTFLTPIFISGFTKHYHLGVIAGVGYFITSIGYSLSFFANGIHFLYFTFGFLVGCGTGIYLLVSFSAPQLWFKKYRAFAAGIALCGYSVGNFISPPLTQWLINTYTWRGCMLLLGGITFQGILFSALISSPPKSDAEKEQEKGKPTSVWSEFKNFSVLKEKLFWVLGVALFLRCFGWSVFWKHMNNRAVFLGIDKNTSPMFLSIASIVNTAWRVPMSVISNVKCVNRSLLFAIGGVGCGIVDCLMMTAYTFVPMAVFSGVFAIFHCAQATLFMTIIGDLFGVDRCAKVFSLVNLFSGIGLSIATPFAGWIFDITQNYDIPFGVHGGIQILGGFVMLGIAWYSRGKGQDDIEIPDDNDNANTELENEEVTQHGSPDSDHEKDPSTKLVKSAKETGINGSVC